VTDAIETSRPLVDAGRHHLTTKLAPPRALLVDADATRLTQIVANLLNNAAKYTPEGGHIQVLAERDGAEAVITVQDSGIGLTRDMLSRVFDMFAQVERSVVRAQGGLGIGLALVKSFAELHGGMVEARSGGPGTGSEFIVHLPVSPLESGNADRRDDAPGSAVQTCRILVVDDNHDGCDSMAALLKIEGHTVHTAYDGVAAIAAANEFSPQVVLMDLGMPKMNGYDACRQIRDQPWGKDLLIIAMTGWGQEEDKLRARQAGFDAHLVKPIDPGELQRLLAGMRGK
jgi:CheY-like chemotaxis protein